jgi:hypothetical protein
VTHPFTQHILDFGQQHKGLGPFELRVVFFYDEVRPSFKAFIVPDSQQSAHAQFQTERVNQDLKTGFDTSPIANWIASAPYLWQPCEHFAPDPEEPWYGQMRFKFSKDTLIHFMVSLDHSKVTDPGHKLKQSNKTKITKNGIELSRYAAFVESLEGPFEIWTGQNRTRHFQSSQSTFKAPRSGEHTTFLDALRRQFTATLLRVPKNMPNRRIWREIEADPTPWPKELY